MKRWELTGLLVGVLLLLTAAALLSPLYLSADAPLRAVPAVELLPDNSYTATLHVTADVDCAPYSFLDESGNPSGHDVELIAAICNRLRMNLDLQLTSWPQALAAVSSGEADVVMGAELLNDAGTRSSIELSVPLVSDPFMAFGITPADNISQLYNKRLAIIEGSSAAYILEAYQLDVYCVDYPSYAAAFASVAEGRCDYVLVRYSVGRMLRNSLDLPQVKPTDVTLMDNHLCFGVSDQRPSLKRRIDEAIVALLADGTLDGLQRKWLGSYVKTQTLYEYLTQNSWIVITYVTLVALLLAGYLLFAARHSRLREERLQRLAATDALTGLLNRSAAEERIRSLLDPRRLHALFVIDIDDFKNVNDSLGHLQGDMVLKSLSKGLHSLFRESDIVGRLGGDEFFVLMKDIGGSAIAEEKARQVCRIFENTYARNDRACAISASVGIALYPHQGSSFDVLYQHADTALYLSKERGKNTYTLYDGTVGQGYHNLRTAMDS